MEWGLSMAASLPVSRHVAGARAVPPGARTRLERAPRSKHEMMDHRVGGRGEGPPPRHRRGPPPQRRRSPWQRPPSPAPPWPMWPLTAPRRPPAPPPRASSLAGRSAARSPRPSGARGRPSPGPAGPPAPPAPPAPPGPPRPRPGAGRSHSSYRAGCGGAGSFQAHHGPASRSAAGLMPPRRRSGKRRPEGDAGGGPRRPRGAGRHAGPLLAGDAHHEGRRPRVVPSASRPASRGPASRPLASCPLGTTAGPPPSPPRGAPEPGPGSPRAGMHPCVCPRPSSRWRHHGRPRRRRVRKESERCPNGVGPAKTTGNFPDSQPPLMPPDGRTERGPRALGSPRGVLLLLFGRGRHQLFR